MIHGVCRKVNFYGEIIEGMFLNDKLNGYGRVLFPSGVYFIGCFLDHKKHGPGKFVLVNGNIKEGEWDNGKFIE